KIRILGITTGERSPLNPEWPPLAQEGAGDINVSNWTALLGPKAIPQPIIQRLSAKVIEILNMPDIKARFAAGGVSTIPSTPAELDARIKRELVTYRLVIEKANVHVD
ncbi:MAG TPA: tripartite tricarboxylate transporter substrate-binding protein, partial [Xanthobacteraceae bacterium]|nr:tripartite tricarboxylate transporter substrate-binding protein [Xanthobacteraceae bacterium]